MITRRGLNGADEADQNDRSLWYIGITTAAVLASLVLRVLWLDHLPGVNADEAWFGLAGLHLLDGELDLFWTPSGRLANPFFIILEAASHVVLPRSVWALRLPSVLSGVLLLLVAYGLSKRLAGSGVAIVFTLLMACTPISVVYSRFGWGASQSVLFTLIPLYFALRGRLVAAGIGLVAAALVHPTNALLGVVLLPVAASQLGSYKSVVKRVEVIGAIMATIAALVAAIFYFDLVDARGVFSRLVSLSAWWRLPGNFVRFLSGTTVNEYVAGVRYYSIPVVIDVLIGALCIMMLLRACCGYGRRFEKLLVFGVCLSLPILYLVGGNTAIQPHHERYALFLVAPSYLAISLALEEIRRQHVMLGSAAVVAFGGLFLASSWCNYLQALDQTQGRYSHVTFRTARSEPKFLAYSSVVDEMRPADGKRLRIETPDYWLYWTCRYLAHGDRGVEVVSAVDGPTQQQGEVVAQIAYDGADAQRQLDASPMWAELTSSPIPGAGAPALYRLYRRVPPPNPR